MKLKYKNVRTITTADLFDATDPPLIFTVRTRPDREWAKLYKQFEDDGSHDESLARQLIAAVFLTVSDGGETYDIDTVETVTALQDAIEVDNPGAGGEFVCNIAWSFGINYYSFLGDRLGKSEKLSEPSKDNGVVKTPV